MTRCKDKTSQAEITGNPFDFGALTLKDSGSSGWPVIF
jgi:hypothetical protein